MKTILALLMAAALGAIDSSAAAQTRAAQAQPSGTLRVVVRDPSGAVIPNAVLVLKGTEPATEDVLVPSATSDGQGVATASNVPVGRYAATVTFPGFESRIVNDVRVRAGDNRREVTLPIEKVAESVSVGRDAATAASDPKSERFSNVLSKDQIEALPHEAPTSDEPNLEFLLRYSDLNNKYHAALIELGRSSMLQWTLGRLGSVPFAAPSATIIPEGLNAYLDVALRQHGEIIDAIARKDVDRAEAIAREHARLGRKNLEIALQKAMPGASLVKIA